ncbi:MAG TPA: hypothetical protein VKX16_15070 [Chloroflexota bacterium]|nr:hypothetical protein [Chloroflexota bacterium]
MVGNARDAHLGQRLRRLNPEGELACHTQVVAIREVRNDQPILDVKNVDALHYVLSARRRYADQDASVSRELGRRSVHTLAGRATDDRVTSGHDLLDGMALAQRTQALHDAVYRIPVNRMAVILRHGCPARDSSLDITAAERVEVSADNSYVVFDRHASPS